MTTRPLVAIATIVASSLGCVALATGPSHAEVLVDYPDFSSVDGLTLTGSTVQSGSVLRLTPAANSEAGRVFAEQQLVTSTSFSASFVVRAHSSTSGAPADGFAFVLQPEGDNNEVGHGGGMGYTNYHDSIAVELDIWHNPERSDPNDNHLEVVSTSDDVHTSLGTAAPGFSLYSSVTHVWVDYVRSGNRLTVFAATTGTKPATPQLDVVVDIPAVVGPAAFFGITAATGAANAAHDLHSFRVEGAEDNPCAAPGAIVGTPGSETLTGTPGNDVICGLGGNDKLIGGGGQDALYGGVGNDSLNPGLGADRIVGDGGIDTVTYAGRAGSVVVDLADVTSTDGAVGESDDVRDDVENIIGGNGADELRGSATANVLDGGPGADLVQGGGGADTASYASRTAAQPVVIANDGAPGSGGALDGAGDTIGEDVENLTGGAGDDTLLGNDRNNLLNGGNGADFMDGDAGIDTVTYANRGAAVTARINARPVSGGTEDVSGGRSDTITTSIENLIGGSAGDLLQGSGGNNRLTGGGGADTLLGRNGNDTLSAEDGAADALLDCDGGSTGGATDTAYVDAADPAASGCETLL